MSIRTYHCRRGESSFFLACLPHPIDVSSASEYLSPSQTDRHQRLHACLDSICGVQQEGQ